MGTGIYYKVVSPDGVYYARIGEHIYRHHQYGILDVPGYPAIVQPPAYPTLIAITRLVVPETFAGKMVNMLMGSGLIVLAFAIMRRLFNTGAGLWAAFLVAVQPFFIMYSVKFLTEMTFLFFSMATLYGILRWWQTGRLVDAIAAAFAAGMAYLTRIEGILVVGLALAFIAWGSWRMRQVLPVLIALMVAALVVVGYAGWASSHVGKWVWVPKLPYTQAHRLVVQMKIHQNPGLLNESEEKIQRIMYYSLDPQNRQIWVYQLFWQVIQGETTPEAYQIPMNRWERFQKVLRQNIRNILWIFYRRGVVPLGILLFMIPGIIWGWRQPSVRHRLVFLIIWAIPFSYFIISHVEKRFLLGWAFLLTLLIARGLYESFQWVEQRIGRQRWYSWIAVMFVIMLILPTIHAAWYRLQKENQLYIVTRQLKQEIPLKSRVVTSRAMHAFYNQWVLFRLPFVENPEALQQYVQQNDIQFVLLEHPRDTRYNNFYHQVFTGEQPLGFINADGLIEIPNYTTHWFSIAQE